MKTNLDKLFKTSEKIEQEGIWLDISEDVGFRVRRFNERNPKVKASIAKNYKPYARQVDMGTLSEDREREIFTNLFVEGCLMDWRGIEIDGELKEFDPKLAVKFLLGLPELQQTLFNYAKDFSNFKEEYSEEDIKDLGNS